MTNLLSSADGVARRAGYYVGSNQTIRGKEGKVNGDRFSKLTPSIDEAYQKVNRLGHGHGRFGGEEVANQNVPTGLRVKLE
jgi:hypothetical protein